MLKLELQCPGRQGSNGCPDRQKVSGWSKQGVEHIQKAWAELCKTAEQEGWERDGLDYAYRCPKCSGLQSVSGYSLEVWEKAFALWKAGKPPHQWAGKDGLPTLRQWHNAVHRIDEFSERLKDSPLYTPRAERNPCLPDNMWHRVLSRFRSGEDKQDICTGGIWPTAKQWNAKMERDEAFRQQIHAEWARRSAIADAQVDAAFKRWASSDLDIIEAAQSNAVVQRWYVRISKDKKFAKKVKSTWQWRGKQQHRHRVSAAKLSAVTEDYSNKLKAAKAKSQREYDLLFMVALEHVKNGGSLKTLPPDAATPTMLAHKRGRDPQFAALWWSSVPRREAQFDLSLDWDAMLKSVQQGKAIAKLSGKDNMPTLSQWNYRRRKDKRFAQAADEATQQGKEVRAEARAQKRAKHQAEIAKERALRNRPIGEVFSQQLAQNDMYAAVNAAVPVGLPPHIRDDIIGSMVLAILEGELEIQDVGKRTREYKSQYDKTFEVYRTVSLDQTVPGTDDLKLIDRVSNEDSLWGSDEKEFQFSSPINQRVFSNSTNRNI